jgi:O-methyltransferase
MSTSFGLSPEVIAYLAAVNPLEHPIARRCREETAALGGIARMQISSEQGAVMDLLIRLTGARRAVEVGVFTGYSSLITALAMQAQAGADAYLLACDVSAEWTAHGRRFWREAGVEGVVDLVIAPAADTLAARRAAGEEASYDLAFIDADKANYPVYYEHCLALLRPGGLMLFDNVLWSGKVADPAVTDADTAALRAVAQTARTDARVHAAMAGIGDGLLMCVKK